MRCFARPPTRGRGHRRLRSGCRRGRRRGRNCPVAATRRWWCRESIVAAVTDAVVIPFRPADVCFHPLVPVGPVGILLAVAHSQMAKTPLPTRAVALRHVRLVRVWRINGGNRSRRHHHCGSAQHRSAKAQKFQLYLHSMPEITPIAPNPFEKWTNLRQIPDATA